MNEAKGIIKIYHSTNRRDIDVYVCSHVFTFNQSKVKLIMLISTNRK
jgi:hypothetical protein